MPAKTKWNPKPSRKSAQILGPMDSKLRRSFLKEFRTATLKQLTAEFKSGPRLGSRQEDPSVIMALHVVLAESIAAAPAKAYDRVVNALLDAAHESWKKHQWD